MTTSIKKSIEVKALDASSAEVIKKAANEVQPNPDGSKDFGLNFDSTTGDVSSGISHLDEMYKSDVHFVTSAKGALQLGAILPLAGGKFGERTASSTATFKLFDDNVKAGRKRKVLTAGEKNALEILDKLSGGRKARIKAVMLSSAIITAAEMKSLGLIDDVEGGFVDKYAQVRIEAKNKK